MISVALPVITLTNAADTGADPYLVDIPGWYDTTDVGLYVVSRTDGHGAYDQDPVWDEGRFFTIVGQIIAPGNPTAVFNLRTVIMGLKAIAGQWPVAVSDPKGTRTAMVRLAGKISYEISVEDGVADFAIPVFAKDSRTYGAEEVLSTGLPTAGGGLVFPVVFPVSFGTPGNPGRVLATNTGEVETVSTLEVTGGLGGGFSVVCLELGREIRFEREIPISSTVFVDMRTGQVTIDGPSPVTGFLTRREWWTNPPGEVRTIQFNSIGAVTGAPTLTVRTSPAFP